MNSSRKPKAVSRGILTFLLAVMVYSFVALIIAYFALPQDQAADPAFHAVPLSIVIIAASAVIFAAGLTGGLEFRRYTRSEGIDRRHIAISRGVGTSLLAAALYGIIARTVFVMDSTGFPDQDATHWAKDTLVGILVIGSAILTGVAEGRRYLRSEKKKDLAHGTADS